MHSSLKKLKTGNKLPALFFKKSLCTGDLLTACKIFIKRPDQACQFFAEFRTDILLLAEFTLLQIKSMKSDLFAN